MDNSDQFSNEENLKEDETDYDRGGAHCLSNGVTTDENNGGSQKNSINFREDFHVSVKSSNSAALKHDATDNVSNHYACISFYVIDENTKKIYGLTNRHVTLHAKKTLYKQCNDTKTRVLGSPINEVISSCIDIDVDLVQIDPAIGGNVRNKESHGQNLSVYDEPFNSIYGKEVFKYRPRDSLFEVCSSETPNNGLILSEAEHADFFASSKQEKKQFLVKNAQSKFSVEGESGTALAVKATEADGIMLIGIICGGWKEDFTVCQFLPVVFTHFKDKSGMTLQLYDPTHRSSDNFIQNRIRSSTEMDDMSSVPYGIKIFIIPWTPEQIAPLNFNLIDRTLDLLCIKYHKIDISSYEHLLQKEKRLSLTVSQRESLKTCSVFENDKPDCVALERGLSACDLLYKGKPKAAEEFLKEALLCIPKIGNFGMYLLCKHITYTTWICLVTNTSSSLARLKELLQLGIESLEEDFQGLTGFPTEALGYMFYDFSRYYMNKYDVLRRRDPRELNVEKIKRQKAVDKAKLSVNAFQKDNEQKKSKETMRRLVLAKCQHAYALLGCGHEFYVIPDEVSTGDITQASDIIKSIKIEYSTPLVQYIDYWITKVDLNFRTGLLQEALETTNYCVAYLEGKNYDTGYNRAKFRLEKLNGYQFV